MFLTLLDSPSLTAVRGFESNFRGCETAVEATITCLENKLEELRHDIQQKTLLGLGGRELIRKQIPLLKVCGCMMVGRVVGVLRLLRWRA